MILAIPNFNYNKTYYMISQSSYDKDTRFIQKGKHEQPYFNFPKEDTKTVKVLDLPEVGKFVKNTSFIHEVCIPYGSQVFIDKDEKSGVQVIITNKAYVGKPIHIISFLHNVTDADQSDYLEMINNIFMTHIQKRKRSDLLVIKWLLKNFPNSDSFLYEKFVNMMIQMNDRQNIKLFLGMGIKYTQLNFLETITANHEVWGWIPKQSKNFLINEIAGMKLYYFIKVLKSRRFDIARFIINKSKDDKSIIVAALQQCIPDEYHEMFVYILKSQVISFNIMVEVLEEIIFTEDADFNFDTFLSVNYLLIPSIVDMLKINWGVKELNEYSRLNNREYSLDRVNELNRINDEFPR